MFSIGRRKLGDMCGLQVKWQAERCRVGWVTNELDSAHLSSRGWAIELIRSCIWCLVIPLFFSVVYLMTLFPVSRLRVFRVGCYYNGLMMNWKGFRKKKRLWPNRGTIAKCWPVAQYWHEWWPENILMHSLAVNASNLIYMKRNYMLRG